jgi:hypothetical protein
MNSELRIPDADDDAARKLSQEGAPAWTGSDAALLEIVGP